MRRLMTMMVWRVMKENNAFHEVGQHVQEGLQSRDERHEPNEFVLGFEGG